MLYRVLETFAVGQRRFLTGMDIDHTEIEAESPVVPVSQWALMGFIEQPEAASVQEAPAEVALDTPADAAAAADSPAESAAEAVDAPKDPGQ